MKKIIILSALPIFLFLGCLKSHSSQPGGVDVLNGILVLNDPLNGNYGTAPLPNIPVYLKYSSENGFLSSTTTNSFGIFSFSGIDPTQAYTVYAMLDTSMVMYYAQVVYAANTIRNFQSDSLKLIPMTTGQNGIFYQLLDNANGALPNCSFYIFGSQALWNNNDSIGSLYKLTSDSLGRVLLMNMPPASPYYIRAEGEFGNLFLEGADTVTVGVNGIVSRTLHLSPLNNGIIYYLQDSLLNPLRNFTLYIYNNRSFWTNTNPLGYNYSLVSDSLGRCIQLNVIPGEYYGYAIGTFNEMLLQGADSISVQADSITTTYLQLTQQH